MLLSRFLPIRQFLIYSSFCTENKGTQYSNWVLARAASHNHNIEHLKRKYPKDRYSIHKLTNIQFMCHIVNFQHQYNLRMNEKIILLAQINHILEVMKKNKANFSELDTLLERISLDLQSPDDLACLGTLMCSLSSMGKYSHEFWQYLMDALLVKKFDEQYDEVFGITIALNKYRKNLLLQSDYVEISQDSIVPKIPIIYRNSLDVIRQYITYNLYNIKECKILFQALHQANINEKYFWTSVKDWFNIYIKQQINQKEMDQFFLVNEGAIDKILHDHGIIRPRPILLELTHIVYILSQFGFVSWRFIEFSQDLILYSIDHGSSLFQQYQLMNQQGGKVSLNEHLEELRFYSNSQKQNVKKMQNKYKIIFVNPIDLKNESLVYYLLVLNRAYNPEKKKNDPEQNEEEVYLDPRVTKWLLYNLVKVQMRYTLREILSIKSCQKFLLQQSQLNMKEFVIEKIKTVRSYECTFKDLQEIMDYLSYDKFNVLIPIMKSFLLRSHPSEVLKLIKLIESNEWLSRLVQVIMVLPKTVNAHYKYYSFEQNCFFLFLFLKNEMYWENQNGKLKIQFETEKQKLKESIKIVTYSRGFKLSINSYFHKIMEYIDVVQFFQGGTI